MNTVMEGFKNQGISKPTNLLSRCSGKVSLELEMNFSIIPAFKTFSNPTVIASLQLTVPLEKKM